MKCKEFDKYRQAKILRHGFADYVDDNCGFDGALALAVRIISR